MSARLPGAVGRLPRRVRLAAAIQRLPETQRLVLALRLLDGLSTLETAGALKLTVRDVESRYTTALETLASKLGSTLVRAA